MERDPDRHDFTETKSALAHVPEEAVGQQSLLPAGHERLTKAIAMTEEGQYAVGHGASCEGPEGLSTNSLPQGRLLILY